VRHASRENGPALASVDQVRARLYDKKAREFR
jgi:hypothetical protein